MSTPKPAKKSTKKAKSQEEKWSGARRTTKALTADAEKTQRKRVPKTLPQPPADGLTAWSKQREELKGFHVGLQARALEETSAYKEHLLPFLQQANPPGRSDAQYSTVELERAEFAQRAAGFVDKKTLVEKLQLMKMAPVRQALDFDRPRNPEHRAARLTNVPDGIPSEPTFTRHNQSLHLEMRVACWEATAYELRDQFLSMPGVAEELRTINLDGFQIPIVFTAPRTEVDEDGVVHIVNSEYVTAPDAGYLPKDSHGNGSTGYGMVLAVTSKGTPLAWRHGRISDPEEPVARVLVREEIGPLVDPYLRSQGLLAVISTDGNFASNEMRREVRQAGLIENIHHVSHVNHERADDMRTRWIPFEGYDERWGTNGHHEVVCWCGHGQKSRVFELGDDGVAGCRVYGQCDQCGFISVTSGEWVRASNPPLWERRDPSDKSQVGSLSVGNGLTFDNALAQEYGRQRFWYGEGFHGALVNRYKLGCGKRYFRTLAHARLDTAMVMSAIYICSIEQRVRAAAASGLLLAA